MPCFKGVAVSIHTPEGPLPEYSIQKQTRQSRIASYIPVPPPKVPTDSLTGKPEQSTFAISVTLLLPGQRVPYSAPKPTPEDPYPLGRLVGSLPGTLSDRGRYGPVISPYVPRTTSPNETLAAYIYFDGRPKEEVATLLRKGEETWVNSRWVSIPASEGGGLAEREFLFREVGLERWLNGLDLVGKDTEKAAKIERRHRKLERQRQIKTEQDGSDNEDSNPIFRRNGVLRYGADQNSPTENVVDDIDLSDDSDDEPPEAEAAGQIKVALFRVLASGEIKKGEYEAHFDAHDDEVEDDGGGGDADIEHTTSFAKPKTLDPKSISTQTVTGLDPADSPYAVFTFMYRGDKQLRKMGILESPPPTAVSAPTKRKSTDFSKLNPLNKFGTVGFTGYREQQKPKKNKKDAKSDDDDMMDDSDDDRIPTAKDDDGDVTSGQRNGGSESPVDLRRQGELAEGVRKIKLKRQHSSEALNEPRKSPNLKTLDSPPAAATPQSGESAAANAGSPPDSAVLAEPTPVFASPFKKQRASVDNIDSNIISALQNDVAQARTLDAKSTSEFDGNATAPVAVNAPPASVDPASMPLPQSNMDEDEEL